MLSQCGLLEVFTCGRGGGGAKPLGRGQGGSGTVGVGQSLLKL